MKYYCNPININYRYQFNQNRGTGKLEIAREAADPSMICFQGRYYIFASMSLGVWVSEDLANWENHRLPEILPMYDYAPDVRVIGEYVYFSASKRGGICNFYCTKDILNGPYEEIEGSFDFWDPNLFADDDGRVYFYWGCANTTPIWGVELDPETMRPLTERKELIWGNTSEKGYERCGEDHCMPPLPESEVEVRYRELLESQGIGEDQLTEELQMTMRGMVSQAPYIEGPWMEKYKGKYYLQYAFPGAEYNVYGDGVYVSDFPLGPFELAENNPYSYKPGGFMPGAGHGSTMWDKAGNFWHTSTMRISVNHQFERRVGLWQGGFDADGELFCNERYGDWPVCVRKSAMDPWRNPDWYLLSYGKKMSASSFEEGKGPEKAADENVRTWWRAAHAEPGEWLCIDLGEVMSIHAVQINFADDTIDIPVPGTIRGGLQPRYIEERDMATRWILEGSSDGVNYEILKDKSNAATDLPHDFVVIEEGIQLRFLKLTVLEVPYRQKPCISGLRVFGIGNTEPPEPPDYTAERISDIDMDIKIKAKGAVGYNILWGASPEKLYHSYMIFGNKQRIGALVKGRDYYVRVDAFNENGITEGKVKKLQL